MKDWLNTFGKFDASIGRYIPTNDKSLVVRNIHYFQSRHCRTDIDRCQSFPREHFSAPSLHSLWQTWLAVNGVSSLLAVFSPSEWDYNWTHIGQHSSSDVVCLNEFLPTLIILLTSIRDQLLLALAWYVSYRGNSSPLAKGERNHPGSCVVFGPDVSVRGKFPGNFLSHLTMSCSAHRKDSGARSSVCTNLQVSANVVVSSVSAKSLSLVTIGALLAAIVLNATKNRPNHSSWRVC